MPKNRKRVPQPGGKSLSIRTKAKIGGRKSSTGAFQLSTVEIEGMMLKVRKRDRNKLLQQLKARGIAQ